MKVGYVQTPVVTLRFQQARGKFRRFTLDPNAACGSIAPFQNLTLKQMKLISCLTPIPLLTLLGGLTTATSFGGTILQNVGFGDAQIAYYDPIGQSFVADDVQLTTVAFAFSNMNPASPNTPITMSLYQGSGFGGPLLDSVTQTLPGLLPGINDPLVFIEFDFTGNSLLLGATYTVAVTTTSSKVGLAYNQNDVYAGGELLESYGPSDPAHNQAGFDLAFRIVTVPEPGSAALGAVAGLAALMLRRRSGR
jgi:hypothetical protein